MTKHSRSCDCDSCYDDRRISKIRWCLNGMCCGQPAAEGLDYCCEPCEVGEEPVMDCVCVSAHSAVA